jgi:hypothetical protein
MWIKLTLVFIHTAMVWLLPERKVTGSDSEIIIPWIRKIPR